MNTTAVKWAVPFAVTVVVLLLAASALFAQTGSSTACRIVGGGTSTCAGNFGRMSEAERERLRAEFQAKMREGERVHAEMMTKRLSNMASSSATAKAELEAAKARFEAAREQMKQEYERIKAQYEALRHSATSTASSTDIARMSDLLKQVRAERFKKICSRLTATSTLPHGYGAPFNTQSPAREMLYQIHCDGVTTDAALQVGTGSSTHFIYDKGYVWKNNAWQMFNLDGDGKKSGGWHIGSARADLPLAQGANKDNFILTFTCQWTGTSTTATSTGGWKCGCRDKACAVPGWQLQIVRTPEAQ